MTIKTDLNTRFVTVDYIASLLHADRRTVCKWLATGRLRATRPGGVRWLIERADLDAFIEAASNQRPVPVPPEKAATVAVQPHPEQNPLSNLKNKSRGSK